MAKMQIIIELDAQGQISVGGPIHDKVLCYGLLEAAKDAVRDHVARLAREKTIKTNGVVDILSALPKIAGS
jgi:hypothetical protein